MKEKSLYPAKAIFCQRQDIQRLLTCIICLLNIAFGPAIVGKVKEGNRLYQKGNYEEALKKYTDAQIDRPESPELSFNIADILYKQRKYNEAQQMLEKAIPQSDPQLEAKIYYNIGNCRYRQGDLRGSLDYYKKALELNPNDEDAKYNIEFVEKKIKEMLSQVKERQENQRTQKQKQEGTEEKTRHETQQVEEKAMGETQPQESATGETQPMEIAQGETQPAEQNPQEKMEGTKPEGLSKEEAETLLRMMADEEKNAGRPEDKNRRKPSYYPEVDKPW